MSWLRIALLCLLLAPLPACDSVSWTLSMGLAERALSEGDLVTARRRLTEALAAGQSLYATDAPELARAEAMLATLDVLDGDFATAEERLLRALPVLERTPNVDLALRARALRDLGLVHEQAGRLEEAEVVLRRALAPTRAVFGPEHLEYARTLLRLANVESRLGRFDAALPRYQAALAIAQGDDALADDALADDALADDALADELRAMVHTGRAGTFARQDRFDEAEAEYRAAIDARMAAVGETDLRVAQDWARLADLHEARQRHDRVLEAMARALEIRRAVLGDAAPLVALTRAYMADIARRAGDEPRAAELRDAAIAGLEARVATDPAEADLVAAAFETLGRTAVRAEDWTATEAYLRRALAVRDAAAGTAPADLALALNNLGVFLQQMDRAEEALPLHERALALRRQALGDADPAVAGSWRNLGLASLALGRASDAEAQLRSAIKTAEGAFGADDPRLVPFLVPLASLLTAGGRTAEADELVRRAQALAVH